MNERERAVCARVKASREDIKWPQSDFADAIGITKDKLASIEYGRTPLRYRTGVDLCEAHGLSAEWLITGNGQMHGGAPTLWEVEFPFESYGNKLFTEIYDLAPRVFRPTERVFGLNQEPTPGFDAKAYLSKKLDRWFQKMKFRTPADAERFARCVDDFAERTLQELLHSGKTSQKRLSQLKAEHEAAKKEFDNVTVESNMGGVKSKISETQKLRDDLKHATAKPGMKAKLARFMKVDPPRVSEWLSGQEPGGEYALKLRAWADEQLGHKSKK